MRYNSNELQVGGKCLIQVEDENSNNDVSSTTPDYHDSNNRSNNKSAKREPLFYHGHIQEMSKNEGPVVVYIEEIGEKRVVPYSRLKPIAFKKSRQSPPPMNHTRRNSAGRGILYEPSNYEKLIF